MRLGASATQTPVWRLRGKRKTSWLSKEMKALMKTAKTLFGILTITAALGLQGQAQPFLTNGLVAYYPFNGNANDASGNGDHGREETSFHTRGTG